MVQIAQDAALAADIGDGQIIAGSTRNNSHDDEDAREVAIASSSGEAERASTQGKSATCSRHRPEWADDVDGSEVSEVDEGPVAGDDVAAAPRRVRTDRVLVLRPLARRRMWAWVGKIALKDGRLVAAQAPFGDG